MDPIPYGKQHISQNDINAVIETLKSDFLTQGPKILEFEKAFSKYVDSKYAVALSNGTAALHLCTLALNVNEGQKVITTPITFAASANCVLYCGGQIDFVDIEPNTGLMDLDTLYNKIKKAPKGTYSGIIPVDFAGFPVNLEKLREIANEFNLWIIEDACHAPGGYFIDTNDKKQFCGNGQFADLAIFSFHPVKHIAAGEGGMVTTNNESLYKKLLKLRTHGITKDPELLIENQGGWYYEMQELGYNYRMPDINAALALSQLQNANKGLERRRKIARIYDEAFINTDVKHFSHPEDDGHAYHLYVIQVPRRKELYEFLRSKNIFTQVHYIPVHTFPYYKNLGWKNNDFPVAESYYQKCLSLPIYPTLNIEEQQWVIDNILSFFNE